jgi:hypothetical protein
MTACPICYSDGCNVQTQLDWARVDCRRCGAYAIHGLPMIVMDVLQQALGLEDQASFRRRSMLSHRIRRRQPNQNTITEIRLPDLSEFRLDDPLPFPQEQIDALVLWVGTNQPSPAVSVEAKGAALAAWVGSPISKGLPPDHNLGWLLQQPETMQLVNFTQGGTGGTIPLRLTMKGWERFDALSRAVVESQSAFMAMKFGDTELDGVFEACFKNAVRAAGYELRRLTDGQPAGLIDDQLRVALRRSRFVIADLTHGNQGAYWEAGFAEGLGKPVIYTCREHEWNERRTHFDTNHMNTIVWDATKLNDVGRRLTATIRATLPADSLLTDESSRER